MSNDPQTYGIKPDTAYLQPFVIVKPEDETRTNTVANARDNDLIVPINPFAVVVWSAKLFFYGGAVAAAGNAKGQWVTPAAATYGGVWAHWLDPALVVNTLPLPALAGAYNANYPIFTNVAGDVFTVMFDGFLYNGANGGYLSWDWSQNGLNANPSTLLRGSRIEAWIK